MADLCQSFWGDVSTQPKLHHFVRAPVDHAVAGFIFSEIARLRIAARDPEQGGSLLAGVLLGVSPSKVIAAFPDARYRSPRR